MKQYYYEPYFSCEESKTQRINSQYSNQAIWLQSHTLNNYTALCYG